MHINLSEYPSAKKTYSVDFPTLNGGLNLWELPYLMPTNQSPKMKNLLWKEGILQSRRGQSYVTNTDNLGTGYTSYDGVFENNLFFHIGSHLYRYDLTVSTAHELVEVTNSGTSVAIPSNRGTFFRYFDYLFYKNNGGFFRIKKYGGSIVVEPHSAFAFVPTLFINGNPGSGSGDMYQPDNRISDKLIVKYNAAETQDSVSATGDGTTTSFSLGKTSTSDFLTKVASVYIDGTQQSVTTYTVNLSSGTVTFTTAPSSGSSIVFNIKLGVTVYHLPEPTSRDTSDCYSTNDDPSTGELLLHMARADGADIKNIDKVWGDVTGEISASQYSVDGNTIEFGSGVIATGETKLYADYTIYQYPFIDAVNEVSVNGRVLENDPVGTNYDYDLWKGTVTFTNYNTFPKVTEPTTNNTVVIEYTRSTSDSAYTVPRNALMTCKYVSVTGGNSNNLCILVGGCSSQPNAVFWNSNDSVSMNPGYFPVDYYNLVGDSSDPVTGFGRQYSDTIVLKEHSIGKLELSTLTVDDRDTISITYTNINSKTGCDLPWSIQLIENNLTFCNTYQGVHILRSSSAAYENNVECISRNVNGDGDAATDVDCGLLLDIRTHSSTVTSFDDDRHYWLCVNGRVYMWDYVLSSYDEPSWFFMTNIQGVAYMMDDNRDIYHLNSAGRVTKFINAYSDYSTAFDKLYKFPTQFFGGYERLKDIVAVMLTVHSSIDSHVSISYETDYGLSQDQTGIKTLSWHLVPRNLAYRCLFVSNFGYTAKRKPGWKHIKHFNMTLENNNNGEGLSIVSAKILYNYQGKER